MPAIRIIPPFNVGEDGQLCFLMRTEGSTVEQLTFKRGEEALAQRVDKTCRTEYTVFVIWNFLPASGR